MNTTINTISGFSNMPVTYSLIQQQEKTNRLAIFLPGLDYNAHSPIFHYCSEILGQQSYTILSITYPYFDGEYDWYTDEEKITILKKDISTVLDLILKDHSYESFFILAKSLGTVALSAELSRKEFENAKIVWLTPLLNRADVYSALFNSTQKGICFSGDKDEYYSAKNFSSLSEKDNLSTHLIKGANHSLEHEANLSDSIKTLEKILVSIKKFQQKE